MRHEVASGELLSGLYLHAVLPALAELVEHDAAAREAAGRRGWRVRLCRLRGGCMTIDFNGNQLTVDPGSHASALTLLFLSDRHLVSTFQGHVFPPPLPVWGQWHLPKVGAFTRLSGRLAKVMDEPSANPECRARLLFGGLLTRALVELADNQTSARRQLRAFEPFLIEFRVGNACASWFGCVDGKFAGGAGQAPRPPDTAIHFRDLSIASAAAAGSLDQLAAIGGGDIQVLGRIPLADTLDVLLDRIGSYLT